MLCTRSVGRARIVVAALTGAGVLGGAALPALAAPAPATRSLKCAISMTTTAEYDADTGLTTYTVKNGNGSCLGDLKGTRLVSVLDGTGTSAGFGPGSGCPTSTTANFTLTLTLAVTSTSTGDTKTLTAVLNAPGYNDIPGVQPVGVRNPARADDVGAGAFAYRIAHNCATGNDSTEFIGAIPI